jgi:hypothetical protein
LAGWFNGSDFQEATAMFRCENCGSGYSMRAASSWECCPRCLAREQVTIPLIFELGWMSRERAESPRPMKRIPLERDAAEASSGQGDAELAQ